MERMYPYKTAGTGGILKKGNELLERKRTHTVHDYGICNTCTSLRVQKSQYGKEFVWCDEDYDITGGLKPNRVDPIIECHCWYPKGHPSLDVMTGMAYLLNVKPKNKIGFGVPSNDEEKFDVEVVEPKEDERGY